MRAWVSVGIGLVGSLGCPRERGALADPSARPPRTDTGPAATPPDPAASAPLTTPCQDGPPPPSREPREPLDRTVAKRDRKFGAVTCRRDTDVWFDAAKRMRVCTTAKAVTLFGISIPAGAYTHFFPDGRPAQTRLARRHELSTAAGLPVACAAGGVSLSESGAVLHCRLAAALTIGAVQLRRGDSVAFHDDGGLFAGTTDRPYDTRIGTLPAGVQLTWSADGSLSGGHLSDTVTLAGLPLRSEFSVYPNGRLDTFVVAEATTVAGHAFEAFDQIRLRPDGSLQASTHVDYDFMIHGELVTLTTRAHYDCAGETTSTDVDRHVADERPPKFR